MTPEAGWEAFAAAPSAEARCRAWLALMAARLPRMRIGVVLIESPATRSYLPMAIWSRLESGEELARALEPARLGALIETALQTRRSQIKPLPEGGSQLAYPLWASEHIAGVIALESDLLERELSSALHEIHWGAAHLTGMLTERERNEALAAAERLGAVLESLALAVKSGQKLQETLIELANALRLKFDCARVAIGLARHASLRLAALSDAAAFSERSPLIKCYEQAMTEAHDANSLIASPPFPEGGPAPWHEALIAQSGAEAALSCPLVAGGHCAGVITLERDRVFTEAERVWLEAFGVLLSPIIELRRQAEQGALRRLGESFSGALGKFFGPRHLLWKAGALVALVAALMLAGITVDYRVSAKTVVEGEIQRVVAAPFGGFIGAAFARAGDEVTAGQILARLDERELLIEEARWQSERDQYGNRLREATAKHDLAAMEVIGAQFRQAQAQLALVSGKIARAKLTAPFDGVVVSGDLSQQIGAPVEEGKTLFEVAPLKSYRVILQVDERDIRHIQVAQPGSLVMTGIAGEPMPFEVAKVTPVASARDGQNYFRVEADLSAASPRLRPGMEGIGKIETGRRSLWWILTHDFSDWLTLWLWTWMP